MCRRAPKSKFTLLLALSMVLIAFTQCLRADIVIDGYTPNTNDRFTNNGAFVGTGLNFSGVGQMQGAGNLGWATAISRNVIISAAHATPANAISFFPTNDPSTVVTRNIIAGSGYQVPGTDLYLAVLDSDLPSSIQHYSYATQALSGPNNTTVVSAGIYQGLNAYMFGRSPAVNPDDRDQAVGRNRITGYIENIDFNGNSNVDALLMFYDASANTNYVQYEAYLQGGDSGAPLFVDIAGQLVLLGTNAFINDGGIGGNPAFSGINYTGNQASIITGFVTSAPEPSSLTLIALGGLGALLRRRRSA